MKHFMVAKIGRALDVSFSDQLRLNDAPAFWWIPLYTWPEADRPMRVIRRLINARGHGQRACGTRVSA